ncbi:hypothetical protein [Scopulibacillus cellulosilyticus]|uniref:DUF998 domain-containing protein n=1 Tax=Scopulibacillus cellulosilyticus TaxID=2665665 RepID=A0ABW2PPW1_9BACL
MKDDTVKAISGKSMPMYRRIAPAVGLFFLSPLVAEFLLGNISISAIFSLLFLAPMYGGGAILIREITRRTNRRWVTMILLGLAYGVLEEGLITQSLFNPSYANENLLSIAHIPVLGIGAWWTLFVLTLHTVWSTSIPIVLTESLVPRRRTAPWLGKIGLGVTIVLFILGAIGNFYGSYAQSRFLADAPQLIGTMIAIIVLVVIAFCIKKRSRRNVKGTAPNQWLVGLSSFVASSLFMVFRDHGWVTVGFWIVLYIIMIILCTRWSRSEGWGLSHQVALAGGALLTYAWHGFPEVPVIGAKGTVDLIGNIIFAIGAIVLLILTLNRVKKSK